MPFPHSLVIEGSAEPLPCPAGQRIIEENRKPQFSPPPCIFKPGLILMVVYAKTPISTNPAVQAIMIGVR